MAGPVGLPVIDTMIGFPHEGSAQYDFIRKQTKDRESKEDFEFPVEYMFKDVPKGLPTDDPVSLVLQQMDQYGIEKAMIGVSEGSGAGTQDVPGPLHSVGAIVDPNDVMGSVNASVATTSSTASARRRPSRRAPSRRSPSTTRRCIRSTRRASNSASRSSSAPACPDPGSSWAAGGFTHRRRHVRLPRLVFVTRHGCEPWEDLAVKLMLKWPNLYYSTSAFAPKYYPKAIIDYANTRGADKVIYAGYFPMGLSLERIFSDLPNVALKDEVWPKFLYDNAARILGLEG